MSEVSIKKDSLLNERKNFLSTKDIVLVLAGILSLVKFNFIGEIYIGEIILLFSGLYFFVAEGAPKDHAYKIMKYIIGLFIFWIFMQSFVDFLFESYSYPSIKYKVRVIFMMLDVISIYIISGGKFYRVMTFMISMYIFSFLPFVLDYYSFDLSSAPDAVWKFGGYRPFVACAFLAFGYFQMKRGVSGKIGVYTASIFIWALTIFSLIMNCRSLTMMIAIAYAVSIIWYSIPDERLFYKSRAYFVIVATALSLTSVSIYNFMLENDLLIEGAREKHEMQANDYGNFLFGARLEMVAELAAIGDSPLIGHGAGAPAGKYFSITSSEEAEILEVTGSDAGGIPQHSMVLDIWVNGGIFCAFIAILIYYRIYSALFYFNGRSVFAPLATFMLVHECVEMIIAPFGGAVRIVHAASLCMAVIILVDYNALKGATRRRQPPAPRPASP